MNGAALTVFVVAYFVNMLWISVFYHRALCHRAIALAPWLQRFAVAAGPWIVGIDPKAWVCMHRAHHLHSDTVLDPHSPMTVGVIGVAFAQLRSYRRTLAKLIAGQPQAMQHVADLGFDVHAIYPRGLWFAPYLLHVVIALVIAGVAGWTVGVAFLVGLSSHPVQGWLVNALAHRWGGRRFETGDHSRNNRLVALLCFGEGLQNNHHHEPQAACFSRGALEVDTGWWTCRAMVALGLAAMAHEGVRGGAPPGSQHGEDKSRERSRNTQ